MTAVELYRVWLENSLLWLDNFYDLPEWVPTSFAAFRRISSDGAALSHVSIANPTHLARCLIVTLLVGQIVVDQKRRARAAAVHTGFVRFQGRICVALAGWFD